MPKHGAITSGSPHARFVNSCHRFCFLVLGLTQGRSPCSTQRSAVQLTTTATYFPDTYTNAKIRGVNVTYLKIYIDALTTTNAQMGTFSPQNPTPIANIYTTYLGIGSSLIGALIKLGIALPISLAADSKESLLRWA